MKEVSSIADLEVGNKIKLFAVCEAKSRRKTKNGDLYLDILLRDKSESIYSKLWSNVNHFKDRFIVGDIVFVKGKVDTYRKQKQINISSIGKVDEQKYLKYGFSQNLVYRYIDEDLESLWLKVSNYTNHLKSNYRPVVKRFICNNKKYLLEASNSSDLKFQLSGSLVKNLFECLSLANHVWESYPSINKNVVIISLFLKYIAIAELLKLKINKSNFTLDINRLCDDYLKISGIKNMLRTSDLRTINNVFSLGSSKSINQRQHASIESTLVNELGNQVRIISIMDQIISADDSKGNWTDKFNPLRRKLFKG